MKNKALVISAILLVLSIGNYFRLISVNNVRPVEFLSIFVIGVLSGILLTLLFKNRSDKQ